VTRVRERHKEAARQIALEAFTSARPYVNLRLSKLQSQKESLPPREYLEQLAQIAFDLWDVGSRRSAWMALYTAYPNSRSALEQKQRVEIGTRLLEMLIAEGQPDMVRSWIGSFSEEVEALPEGTPYRDNAQRAIAEWCYHMGNTDDARPRFEALMANEQDARQRNLLKARLKEIQLLLGETTDTE
jgi:hypothetical protein